MKCIIVLGLTILSFELSAQTNNIVPDYPTLFELTHSTTLQRLNLSSSNFTFKNTNNNLYRKIEHTAFFCKIEDQLSNSVKFPVKIRLGEVSYAEKLEGKNAFDRFSLPH